jgi:hypothetical protein
VKIHVTQEHIEKGRSSYAHCPIALAMKDAGFKAPRVWKDRASWIGRTGIRRRKRLPRKAVEFVARFDSDYFRMFPRRSVTPFSFDLDVTS